MQRATVTVPQRFMEHPINFHQRELWWSLRGREDTNLMLSINNLSNTCRKE
jgi:hypothetical protein